MRLQTRRSGTASLSARFNQRILPSQQKQVAEKHHSEEKFPQQTRFQMLHSEKGINQNWDIVFFPLSSFQSLFWMSALLLVELEGEGGGSAGQASSLGLLVLRVEADGGA